MSHTYIIYCHLEKDYAFSINEISIIQSKRSWNCLRAWTMMSNSTLGSPFCCEERGGKSSSSEDISTAPKSYRKCCVRGNPLSCVGHTSAVRYSIVTSCCILYSYLYIANILLFIYIQSCGFLHIYLASYFCLSELAHPDILMGWKFLQSCSLSTLATAWGRHRLPGNRYLLVDRCWQWWPSIL